MRILHIGSGFRHWRRGGLVAYVEDLMDEQAGRGEEVAYFFSGRQYPLARGPRLRRWQRRRIPMYEVIDSPLYDHGRQPELEVNEPAVEALLEEVLAAFRPDVVHVHELAGLPSSLLVVIAGAGLPIVMTLQDYFPLCSTFKLFDAQGGVCLRREVGEDCLVNVLADRRRPGVLIESTVAYHLAELSIFSRLPPQTSRRLIGAVARTTGRLEAARRARRRSGGNLTAEVFQQRRELNVSRLSGVDVVVAMSKRVRDIYAELGVDESRLRTLQLTLGHIERLAPRRRETSDTLTFATLGAFESAEKGAEVLIGAVRLLEQAGLRGRFRVIVFGHVDPGFAGEARSLASIELRRDYAPRELDGLLDDVDVGLMPSIWEEAYGYAGVEFLAKGIPVLANRIGGLPEYTREGATGWLNDDCSARGMAAVMHRLIERPGEVRDVAAMVHARRAEIVKPMARHDEEMRAIYAELVGL